MYLCLCSLWGTGGLLELRCGDFLFSNTCETMAPRPSETRQRSALSPISTQVSTGRERNLSHRRGDFNQNLGKSWRAGTGGTGACTFCEHRQSVWGWLVMEELARCSSPCWSVQGMQTADSSGFLLVSACVHGGEQLQFVKKCDLFSVSCKLHTGQGQREICFK